jgi:hypothetical protein
MTFLIPFSSDAFEVLGPEVVKLEEIAKESSRAVGDYNCIGLSDSLQARREVGGLADNAALLSFA